jgi:3-(3-hydroxy-phenyl)propionate hydroxylase
MRMPGETREQMESDETCWRLLEPWGVRPGDGTIVRRTVYTFESQLAQRWRDRRVLLAGDAAHTMPPFMAQGLCSGFRDALNLSWKLDMVLRGGVRESLLDSYELERKPHVEAITRMAMSIGALVTETDPQRAKARDTALAAGEPVLPHGFPILKDGLLARGAGNALAPLAGEPAPQARAYRDGRVARLDDHIGRGWRIVARHAVKGHINGHAPLLRALDMSSAHITRGCLADSFLDIDADYASWFARSGVEVFVQRPDMYIFGAAAKVADLPQLLESLDAQMRGHGVRFSGNA